MKTNNKMKKIIVALTLVFTISSAFAKEVTVTKQVLQSFTRNFSQAKEITWTVTDSYYRASFTLNEQKVFAFFNCDGLYLGLTRYISSFQLPLNLQSRLKRHYGKKWITDLFEMTNDEGTAYYITVEDSDTKIILNASSGSDWHLYKKEKKN